jgi:DNA polymerase V
MHIGHVDADCFYVSAERARFPQLRGVPVAVLSNQGACVIAKSYEMKAAGVTTGMPIWTAKNVCPDAIYIKRDFRWYEVLSRKMLELVRWFAPHVEYYSIDEMFFDASGIDLYRARRMQRAIALQVGVPSSVGIASTKTLAKLASDARKPFGCFVATDREAEVELMAGLPVTEITGIARRSAGKLAAYGITTVDEFASADRRLIRKLLTKTGEDLWYELNGTPVTPIHTKRVPHRRIARGGSMGKATRDPARVTAWLYRNTERLIEALDHHGVVCLQLSLELTDRRGLYLTKRLRLPAATSDYTAISQTAMSMLHELWHGEILQYMHLTAEQLTTRDQCQQGLFDQPNQRDRDIAAVKRSINDRIGRFAVRAGSTLALGDFYDDPTCDYDICDIHGKSCF